jgi:hypothetical protein
MNFRLARAHPELILLTSTAISAVNVLVALGVVHMGSVPLAVSNVGLASVIGILARELVPAEPASAAPADGRAHEPLGDSTG